RQAMPNGGRLRIDVRENNAARMVEVRIADTGVGIPPEQLRMIFEPFYTTKQPDEHGHGGTGLGLSVCRQIIEQHQGRIRVESVLRKGSTFTVKLPLCVPEEREQDREERTTESQRPQRGEAQRGKAGRGRCAYGAPPCFLDFSVLAFCSVYSVTLWFVSAFSLTALNFLKDGLLERVVRALEDPAGARR